jgi:hypothetical protein
MVRRGRYVAAIVVALCAMVAVSEYGALSHELVESDAREARPLRALWLGILIVVLGFVSLVRFSRRPRSALPRAAVRR